MTRKLRHQVVVPNLPHHVVARGNNRRRLFSHPRDYHCFGRLLRLALECEAVACVVHQLTLMANHLHMIVTPASVEALARFMKQVCQRYAQRRNRMRKATGKLFEQRYWCRPIEETKGLALATAYNDTNAAQAGLVSDPFSHRWSTIGVHAGEARVEPWVRDICTPSVWYEGLGADDSARALAYREWIAQYLETKQRPESLEGCDWFDEIERPYSLRLERPDRTRARDAQLPEWSKVRGTAQGPNYFHWLEDGE
jgi:putative transposase